MLKDEVLDRGHALGRHPIPAKSILNTVCGACCKKEKARNFLLLSVANEVLLGVFVLYARVVLQIQTIKYISNQKQWQLY